VAVMVRESMGKGNWHQRQLTDQRELAGLNPVALDGCSRMLFLGKSVLTVRLPFLTATITSQLLMTTER
jgi:hypothetical protein